jgi:gluconolactonase
MERSLAFAGYQVEHKWGTGGHNGTHATQLFPDAMTWLWKDWPQPVAAGAGSPQMQEVLLPGEPWKLVGEGYKFTEGPAANAQGEVFFCDVPEGKIYKLDAAGKPAEWAKSPRASGLAFAPDGRLIAGGSGKLVAYDAAGKESPVADGFGVNDLVVLNNGNAYVTNPGDKKVWLVTPGGEKRVVDTGLTFANGVTASPDQSLLYVADSRTHWVYSYQIQPDGSLKHKQKYYWLHSPDTADEASADGLKTDRDGRLYVATRIGVQFCDQYGRVNGVIPTPNGRCANLCFGGEKFDVLYATCGDKVYSRKVKVSGANPFAAPVRPKPGRP